MRVAVIIPIFQMGNVFIRLLQTIRANRLCIERDILGGLGSRGYGGGDVPQPAFCKLGPRKASPVVLVQTQRPENQEH